MVVLSAGGDSLPNSGPASSASSTSSVSIPSPPGSPCMLPVLDPLVEHARLANIQDEFLQSKNFESVDCLALTLEEMVHIRRVLTKADLEDLPLDASVKDEIANGKVRVCLLTSRHCRVSSCSELSTHAPLAVHGRSVSFVSRRVSPFSDRRATGASCACRSSAQSAAPR